MSQFLQRYVQYRRVGFGRWAAFRFAWLVVTARAKPATALRLAKRV
jgi:hypothetical protein